MTQETSGQAQLALLGHFQLTLGDDTLTQFSYDKVKALLLHLLLHDQAVSRAALAELLWPDQGLSSGRTNLRHALHCLRQSLGEEADNLLTVSRQTIALTLPDYWELDLDELNALLLAPSSAATLVEILALYRGDLVEELSLTQCPDFQRWMIKVRGEWRQRVIQFAERVLATDEPISDDVLRTLVSRFSGYGPFHERLVRQLAEDGQSAAAHEQFNAFLQQLALSGQQPDPGFLQLARYWSDGKSEAMSALTPQGAISRTLSLDSAPLREDEIDHRQLSVMAIRLSVKDSHRDRVWARACLTLQIELLRWLEQQCHHLGGFWLPGATGGVGLACFGTHGPAHQLAELVALYEHCSKALSDEIVKLWDGEGKPPVFSLSAGLHSGQVIYLPERQLADPLGQVTQYSLELMTAAEGSELVISLEASQHMPPALDLQPRLTSRLLAADGRVRLRALVLGSSVATREASLPTLIGREGELRRLRDALARASIGLRQSVLVSGNSGMGKSALMVNFRQLEQSQDVGLCWMPTTRLSQLEPYSVVRALIRWRLDGHVNREAVEQLFETSEALQGVSEEARRSFHAILGTAEASSEDEVLIQSSETVERVVRVLHLVIEKAASLRPLVMMIDDLQWLDEPSLKVLAGLQARLPINIGFMLAASHNGRDSLAVKLNWDQHIALGRLDPMQVSRLLSHLSRRYRLHLSPRMRSQLIERCDGVPLYLQEICRRLDMDRREGRPVQLDELPKGLIGLLSSRIDQLEEGRDVAHAAAVLGRVFNLSFVRQSCEFEESRLKRAIENMQRLEIIEACSNDSEFDYQFTHQLIQEAAYLSCPRDVRRRIHHQVVALIEDKYPAWIGRHPGYFAVHLRKSQNFSRAARYFELSARESLKISANRTALKMADNGLACLKHVDGQEEREASLLTVRGQAGFALEGHGSRIAHESFVQARNLLNSPALIDEDEPDLEQAFIVKWGLWVGCSERHAHADAFALASGLSELAEGLSDIRYRRLADFARAHCEFWAGRVRVAGEHLDEIDPLNNAMVLEWLPFSDHPQVAAACLQSWTSCLRCDHVKAEQQAESAIRLAEEIGQPGSLAMALMFSTSLYRQLGHTHLATQRAERALELTRSADLHLWHMAAHGVLGWARAMNGDRDGLSMLQSSINEFAELTGRERHQRPNLWYMDAVMALGEHAAAEEYMEKVLLVAQERNSFYLAEVSYLVAALRAAQGLPTERIRSLIEQGMAYAIEQENPHHEAMGLATWLRLVDANDIERCARLKALLEELPGSDAPAVLGWHQLVEAAEGRARRKASSPA